MAMTRPQVEHQTLRCAIRMTIPISCFHEQQRQVAARGAVDRTTRSSSSLAALSRRRARRLFIIVLMASGGDSPRLWMPNASVPVRRFSP